MDAAQTQHVYPADVPGWLSEAEAGQLVRLARGRRVLEIGSYHGKSTIAIAQVAASVDSIDWHKGDEEAGFGETEAPFRANLERYGVADRVNVHVGTTADIAPTLPAASFDVIFIDGAHDEANVRTDLRAALRLLKPGGVLAMHDFGFDSVRIPALRLIGSEPDGLIDSLVWWDALLIHREQFVFIGLPRRPAPRRPVSRWQKLWAKVLWTFGKTTATLWQADEPEGTIRMVRPAARGKFKVQRRRSSLLNHNFNRLFVGCLNAANEYPLTHFAMCHDDIQPAPCWVDTCIDEMERYGADVCSVVIPIKDNRGLTTTGIRNAETGEIRRLTMREVMQLPETFNLGDLMMGGIDFDAADGDRQLMVNTGLWVARLDRDWVSRFPGFQCRDGIVRFPDGHREARVESEDWLWSQWMGERGVKVIATRKVAVAHVDDEGRHYRNDHAWGEWETDRGDDPKV